METVKVSSKGQIVIPKALRESHHIRTGDVFVMSSIGSELRLKPAPSVKQTTLDAVAGLLYQKGRTKLSDAEIEKGIGDLLLADDTATRTE